MQLYIFLQETVHKGNIMTTMIGDDRLTELALQAWDRFQTEMARDAERKWSRAKGQLILTRRQTEKHLQSPLKRLEARGIICELVPGLTREEFDRVFTEEIAR